MLTEEDVLEVVKASRERNPNNPGQWMAEMMTVQLSLLLDIRDALCCEHRAAVSTEESEDD